MASLVERRKQLVLGGVFGLEPVTPGDTRPAAPFTGEHICYFLNLRCALSAFCEANPPKSAWIPSYLCGSLLDPFLHRQVPIRYYPVNSRLAVECTAWIDDVESGDLVIAIHYFGFTMTGFPAQDLAKKGAVILEDASQALFLPQQFVESSGILYSPRKFIGVPDGGVLVSRDPTGVEAISLAPPPSAWWRDAFAMVQKRRDFDLAGGQNEWFALFQKSEAEFPLGLYRASELSTMILLYGADYEAIRFQRRRNYQQLLDQLSRYAMFSELSDDTVPLGFPVRVDANRRQHILTRLYEHRIYAPVHWRLSGIVPESFQATHSVSQSILTLICDQRCTSDDMDRQASVFLQAVSD